MRHPLLPLIGTTVLGTALLVSIGAWPGPSLEGRRAEAALPALNLQAGLLAGALGEAPVPAGVILLWPGTNATIPAGFVRETTLDGRFPKGVLTGANTTGGAATHTHSSPGHTHTVAAHTHTGQTSTNTQEQGDPKTDSNGSELHNANHYHSYSISAISSSSSSSVAATYSAVSNNPPYTDVIFIRSLGTAAVPPGAVTFFGGVDIPANFQSCDGTNGTLNLLNRYPRGAATGANAGTTGGSTTNSHTIDHTHTVSHAHSGNSGGPSARNTPGQSGCCGPNMADANHVHPVTLNNVDQTSGTNSAIGAQAETVEPAYRKLLAMQNTAGAAQMPRGIIGLWLGDVASVPPGWELCDGQDGRPDMNDRFCKVAANTGEIATSGGSHTHTHAAQSHTHSLPSHSHSGSVGASGNTTSLKGRLGGTLHRYWTNVDGAPHSLASCSSTTASTNSSSTTADSANNEPEYRTVLFIQFNNAPPTDPGSPNPADGAFISNSLPICSWSASTDADDDPISYEFTLSANSNLSSPIVDHVNTGTSTQYACPNLADGVYYWQALAFDGVSYNSNAAIWSFTVDTTPPTSLSIDGMRCDFNAGTITDLDGVGEGGTTLVFYDGNDQVITGLYDWDGNDYTFTPTTPLARDSMVYAVATDAATNMRTSKVKVMTFQAYDDVFADTTVCYPSCPGSSMRLDGDTRYEFRIAVNAGSAVTVQARLMTNANYSGAKPAISLSGLGISGGGASDIMTAGANVWESLAVTGTPNADGVLTLSVETYSTAAGASTWIDEITVSQ